jgi:hypothetical protein
MSLFGIVVGIVFQRVFCLEMHQNNIFFIFLNLFLTSTHQNNLETPKKFNLKQKKITSIFCKNAFQLQKQTGLIFAYLNDIKARLFKAF